jgi:hypothetical protein
MHGFARTNLSCEAAGEMTSSVHPSNPTLHRPPEAKRVRMEAWRDRAT